ncbi:MAG: MFS transporter [Burkholderiaceae bacterium]|nr:MFS transporter [Burkholderiaceae bacterium]
MGTTRPSHDHAMPAGVPARAGQRAWLGLAVLALPCMLYSMDMTVLNLALPTLAAEFRPSATQMLWIVDIYGFMVAGLLITMGTLGDRFGRRRLLLAGAAAFGAASILAAYSTSAAMLVTARALLGIAGATVAPSTLSLIRHLFDDPRERTLAIGIWVASFSVGAAIGPIAGGLLLEAWGWRAVFLVAVPVMVLLLLLGPFLLPEYRSPRPGPLDLPSVGLSILAVVATIHGVKQLAFAGPALEPLAALALGMALGVVFVRRQSRHPTPLIDLAMFRAPGFAAALVVYGLACFIAFGNFLFVALYLQQVLGLSPLLAALWSTPIALAFIVGSIGVPLLARRFPAARVVGAGFALATVGYLGLATVAPGQSPAWIILWAVVFSLGQSPVFTLATDLVVSSAPAHAAGAASSISETVAEFGGATGIALYGSLVGAIYRLTLTDSWPAGAGPMPETLHDGIAQAAGLAAPLADAVLAASRNAFTEAMRTGAIVSAIACIGLAAGAARYAQRRGAGAAPGS